MISDDIELTFIDQRKVKLPMPAGSGSKAPSSTGDGTRLPEAAQINPTGYLNEYCQKLRLSVRLEESEVSSSTGICFRAAVWIGDAQFPPGEAANKKTARREAARIALEYLLARSPSLTPQSVDQQAPSISDNDQGMENDGECQSLGHDLNLDPKTVDILQSAGKPPISMINEYIQRQKLPPPTFGDELLPNGLFLCVLTANNECLGSASGQSKKKARTNAAILAINKLVVDGRFSTNPVNLMSKKAVVSMPELMANASLYDLIANEVHQKFAEAAQSSTEVASSGKVIAGIVLSDASSSTAYVISWATGNRCVKGGNLSQE
uniref:DRBM domain-containing protein n=1 Tax=Plectus sambesii TaxID=2011161 RepID=A0A914XS50_9BILA